MTRSLLPTVTVAAFTLLLLVVSTGCGVGELTPEAKVGKTADDYLRALAEDDTGKACAQLTAEAKAALGRPCPSQMRAIAARVGADALIAAADRGVKIAVDGARGSAEIPELAGARLVLTRVGDEWKIDSGYSLEP